MDFDILDSFSGYTDSGATTDFSTKWTIVTSSGGFSYDAAALSWGSRMLRFGQGSGFTTLVRRTRGANRAAFADGFWFKFNTLTGLSNHAFYWATDGASTQLMLQASSDGSIRLLNGAGTVLGTAAAGTLIANTPQHIAVMATIANAGGAFEVKVDGATVIGPGTGDTQNTANAYTNNVQFGCPDTSGTTLNIWVGELNCRPTNVFAGLLRSQRRPLVASPVQAWTPSAGTDNYAVVDDDPEVSVLDYLDAITNGTVDEFTLGAAAAGADQVMAVRLFGFGRSTDSSLRQINLQCLSGATTEDGANLVLPTAAAMVERYISQDPNTAADWTVGAAETFDLGLKLAA